MERKAVSFDIGHTLVRYDNPLNWKPLYRPALEAAAGACGAPLSHSTLSAAQAVLTRYNTRENPREREVSSDTIFMEIFDAWQQPYGKLEPAKAAFYSFFQAGAVCYDDVEPALEALKAAGVKIGALTDVAYGMDNAYSLGDIAAIRPYFDLVLTSVDVGFRKPHPAGYSRLLEAFGLSPSQMLYVGDEQKDIAGANALGIPSVLIDRQGVSPHWGQTHTLRTLADIGGLL